MKKIVVTIIVLLLVIEVKAQESKIIGNWQLSEVTHNGVTVKDLKAVFIFAEEGVLKAARNESSKSIKAGSWKYNKKKKSIEMISTMDKDFNGSARVIKVNNSELVYKKDGATLSFIKLTRPKLKTKVRVEKPILSFEHDDLLNVEDGFYEEDESGKLPWKITEIVKFLKGYSEIIYNVTCFPDEQETDAWIQSLKISYIEEAQTIDVREYSYLHNDYIDMTENPVSLNNIQEYEKDFHFFPEDKLDVYKVITSNEIVKSDLGNFECTVVEGFGRFENKIKYWMVNDKPGVFVKIIIKKDAPEGFGNTKVFTLKKIK